MSNIYDLVPEYETIMAIAQRCVKQEYVTPPILDRAISKYDLHRSRAWVGGVIPSHELETNMVMVRLLDIMKIGLANRDRGYL